MTAHPSSALWVEMRMLEELQANLWGPFIAGSLDRIAVSTRRRRSSTQVNARSPPQSGSFNDNGSGSFSPSASAASGPPSPSCGARNKGKGREVIPEWEVQHALSVEVAQSSSALFPNYPPPPSSASFLMTAL